MITADILTAIDFSKLIENLPVIEVELDYDGNFGTYENSDFEIDFDHFFINCELRIEKYITTDYGSCGAPEYNVRGVNIEVSNIKAFYYDDEIELTNEQYKLLTKTIQENANN